MVNKRKSIRKFCETVTAPYTSLSRSGYGAIVREIAMRAYRIGLNNGKLIAMKPQGKGESKS